MRVVTAAPLAQAQERSTTTQRAQRSLRKKRRTVLRPLPVVARWAVQGVTAARALWLCLPVGLRLGLEKAN